MIESPIEGQYKNLDLIRVLIMGNKGMTGKNIAIIHTRPMIIYTPGKLFFSFVFLEKTREYKRVTRMRPTMISEKIREKCQYGLESAQTTPLTGVNNITA